MTTWRASSCMNDAELVVDVCMSVEADDVVTIICDDENREQADALARGRRRARRLAGGR